MIENMKTTSQEDLATAPEVISRLGKLFATENLSVTFSATAQTASINVKNRTVVFPIWKDAPAEVLELLISHEAAGHALETPYEGLHDSLSENRSRGFKTFLNVTEDARIEKLVKKRFPGLRKSYHLGYKWMIENGFFGDLTSSPLILIDRLNIAAKAGVNVNFEFHGEEKVFYDRLMALATFDDAVKLAEDLYKHHKDQGGLEPADSSDGPHTGEYEPGDGESDGTGETRIVDFDPDGDDEGDAESDGDADDADSDGDADEDGDADSDGDGDADSDGDADGESDADTDDDGDADSDGTSEVGDDGATDEVGDAEDDDSDAGHEGGSGGEPESEGDDENDLEDDPSSKTDEAFHKAVQDMVDSSVSTVENINVPKVDSDKAIFNWKQISEIFHARVEALVNPEQEYDIIDRALVTWRDSNKAAISWMVKEFEMKKAADEMVRTKSSKTGIIDPLKLHSYSFNDDIFLKGDVVLEGKNHGLVMFIDWSGSMSDHLHGTVEQLLNLVTFCRKVNIPFEVFAFSSVNSRVMVPGSTQETPQDGDFIVDNDLRLLNVFSNRMTNLEFKDMMRVMMGLGMRHGGRGDLGLGGTPLDSSIILAVDIIEKFKARENVQIVNTVFLTDGESSGSCYASENGSGYQQRGYISAATDSKMVVFSDKARGFSKKFVKGVDPTLAFYEYLRTVTESNLLGFFLIDEKNTREFMRAFKKFSEPEVENHGFWGYGYTKVKYFEPGDKTAWNTFKHDKHLIVTGKNLGYTELYLIAGGKTLRASNTELTGVNSRSTKAQMRNQFLKSTKGLKEKRVLLSSFVEKIA